MTLAAILNEVGVTLWAEGDALRYRGPREALARLLPALKTHKAAILAALAHPNLSGIPPEFAARLSPEDLNDIAAGDIPLGTTVQQYEQAAIARDAEDLKEFFEERSAILECDAPLPRANAQLEAARITAALARNRGCLWASLRAALSGYPELLAQVRQGRHGRFPTARPRSACARAPSPAPSRAVSIVITEAEIEAARKGRTVVGGGWMCMASIGSSSPEASPATGIWGLREEGWRSALVAI